MNDVGKSIFRQRDLESSGGFLLDTGHGKLYLWLDSPYKKAELEFFVDCAVRFMYAGMKDQLHVSIDSDTLEIIDKGYEPSGFRVCFNGWNNFPPVKLRHSIKIAKAKMVEAKTKLATMTSKQRR